MSKSRSPIVCHPVSGLPFEDVWQLMHAIYSESDYFSQSFAERYPDRSKLQDEIAESTSGRGGCFLVATMDQRLVGFVMAKPAPQSRLSHTAWRTIGVLSSHQLNGVGRILAEHCNATLQQKGQIEILYLMVRSDNLRAQAFNQALGFEKVALLAGDTKIDGKYYDGVLMRKCLTNCLNYGQ